MFLVEVMRYVRMFRNSILVDDLSIMHIRCWAMGRIVWDLNCAL